MTAIDSLWSDGKNIETPWSEKKHNSRPSVSAKTDSQAGFFVVLHCGTFTALFIVVCVRTLT